MLLCTRLSWRLALLSLFWSIWLSAWATPVAAQARPAFPPDLQALITQSLEANPEIKEKIQLKTASKEAVRPAGTLDDPNFSFNLLAIPVDTWAFNEWDMTQKQLAISQKFPFPGKLKLRSEVAQEQSKSDAFTLQDKINEIRTRVIQKYWTLSLAYASFDITEKNKQWWEQVVKVAESRYAVGRGLQADVLQAQVELGGYLDRLFKWRQRQESLQADLNALRSQPPNTPLPRPQPLPVRPFTLKLDNLLTMAADQPRLQALKAMVSKQDKAVDLARKNFFPDFNVGVAYGLREDGVMRERPDFFSSSFMMNLPIWQGAKLKPRLREQQARRAAAQDAYQTALDRLNSAIKDRYVILQRLDEQIKLYGQGIIPQARQAAETSLAAYQAGTLDFTTLSRNFIALYNAELMLQEYLRDFEATWAELEWLVGQSLPRVGGVG